MLRSTERRGSPIPKEYISLSRRDGSDKLNLGSRVPAMNSARLVLDPNMHRSLPAHFSRSSRGSSTANTDRTSERITLMQSGKLFEWGEERSPLLSEIDEAERVGAKPRAVEYI